jgi:hypothetical protein
MDRHEVVIAGTAPHEAVAVRVAKPEVDRNADVMRVTVDDASWMWPIRLTLAAPAAVIA